MDLSKLAPSLGEVEEAKGIPVIDDEESSGERTAGEDQKEDAGKGAEEKEASKSKEDGGS